MTSEKLFEAFGELLYAIASIDGKINAEEKKLIENELAKYEWGSEISWSFDYETSHDRSLEEAYERALDTFSEYGPFKEYDNFFKILSEVVDNSNKISNKERKVLEKFRSQLLNRFMDDDSIK